MIEFVQATLNLPAFGAGLHEITAPVQKWCMRHKLQAGLVTLFLPHTSASLLIQENADPDVLLDLQNHFAGFARQASHYHHAQEGPDDMPAHIRAALTQTSLSIPLINGELALGTWQGIYLFEHRTAARQRRLHLHLAGA